MPDRTLRARFEAYTDDFNARVAAAQHQLERMERAPQVAARGMRVLQGGMQQLAVEALGLPGPVGRVTQALGGLTLGSPVMLGVMASIGAFALAARQLSDDLKGLEKGAADAAKELGALYAKAGSNVALRQQLTGFGPEPGLLGKLAAARSELARLQTAPLGWGLTPQDAYNRRLAAIATQQQIVNDLEMTQRLLLAQLNESHQDLADQGLKDVAEGYENITKAMKLLHEAGAIVARDVPKLALPKGTGFVMPGRGGPGIATDQDLRTAIAHMQEGETQVVHSLNLEAMAMKQAAVSTDDLAVAVVSGFGNMVSLVVSDTDRMGAAVVSGFFQMASQILAAERAMAIQRAAIAASAAAAGGASAAGSAAAGAAAGGFLAGPWGAAAVVGVSIVGGILGGILGKHRSEPVPVRDDGARAELARVRAELAEARRREKMISLTIGPETYVGSWEEIQYELNRSGRLRGEPRLPGA